LSFLGATITDLAKLLGNMLLCVVFALLGVLGVLVLRFEAAGRFARAVRAEAGRGLLRVYHLLIGNPLRLVGLEGLVEGFETRLPTVLSGALDDALGARAGMFSGYRIVGTLPTGGSGAKIYIADVLPKKFLQLKREGFAGGQVVIKSFIPDEEGALAGIIRESQSLDAASKLGLILEHGSTPSRFYYVMRYVPGKHLRSVIAKLHEGCDLGLDDARTRVVLGYVLDLLETLARYHRGGLWHKDVKPDNVIVSPDPDNPPAPGKAHLVDFGLVTSLRSAMTLTTHGTEYYRDPEMVRMAMQGVKVQDVEGEKFDLYGVGAVLFHALENTFPAQGALSSLKKRVPQAVVWIIRRAMAQYDQRYPDAETMAKDVRTVLAAADMFALKPFALPSMRESEEQDDILSESPGTNAG
jgi:serine/threonine protein kinase